VDGFKRGSWVSVSNAPRAGGQEVGEHRRVVDGAGVGRVVELGVPLHAGHVGAGVVRRIASTMPSSGQRASTTKPGARSLMPWWWMLLTVRGVPAVQRGQPRAGHEFHRVEVVVATQRRGAPATGRWVAMSCHSVPPCITLSSCKPRHTPNTGLPAAMKALMSAIS
jgi:hypothetical protein